MFSGQSGRSQGIWIAFILSLSLLLCTACTAGEPQQSWKDIAEAEKAVSSTPPGWSQLLPFDGIRPIYAPEFIPAGQGRLKDDELVMGVAWDGEAKAFPVTVLRIREMVNDEMAGVPYLVSW